MKQDINNLFKQGIELFLNSTLMNVSFKNAYTHRIVMPTECLISYQR